MIGGLIPIRTNLNLRPHEKTFIATTVRIVEPAFYSDFRFGEAQMPMPPWHPLKRTNITFVNEKEVVRRATLDPWFYFQLVTSHKSHDVYPIEQHEFMHRWIHHLLKS
jgi:hypothetical protein